MKYSQLIENKITLEQLLTQFNQKYKSSIEYGCIRDNCGIPAIDLELFAKQYNYDIPRINGFFKADKPLFLKKDFTPNELKQMKNQGLNPSEYQDRKQFAIQNNLIDELKFIPHSWNEYNGKIIDLTGHKQFVETNIATDLNQKRYTTNNPYSNT